METKFSERITELSNLLKIKGLNQKKFCEKVDVSRVSARKWMNGEVKISDDKWIIIKHKLEQYDRKPLAVVNQVEEGRPATYVGQEISATAHMAMSDAMPVERGVQVFLPMFSRADYVIPVHGQSMKGYINSGDFIAVRRITNIDNIIYGEPYVVITRETNMRTVKFVNQNKEDKTSLWLSPYNTEQFDSQSIKKTDIISMYVVLGKIRNFNAVSYTHLTLPTIYSV